MTSTFRPFPSLPLELRLKIWSYLLPAPRIVDVIAISTESNERQQLSNSNPAVPSPAIPKRARRFVDDLQSPRQDVPVLMHVSREARSLVLKKWRVVGGVKVLGEMEMRRAGYQRFEDGPDWEERGIVQGCGWQLMEEGKSDERESVFYFHPESTRATPVLFNPDIDVLFLADPPSTRKVSSLSVLVRWLERDVVESARNLALPYYSWRKDYTFGNLGALKQFKSLERLWVCFVGDEGKKSAGCRCWGVGSGG
ncbi:uncharacterized protein K444DRAFT_611454 [Hyaloscypha bicolor E]|uniref:2EXR domain-containing protein n=1 Tax=Hyaloscypha bicolor E TaxID=1095630 RepID=A0A2J6TDS7_9HELO|nr:uncharacterized protein K444DRAFT_611454 [Hyaloscypha bicolor E]PMD61185.1 hypothetical protein K444DRAFT_611454 [Hyaloscypha bicolor E]